MFTQVTFRKSQRDVDWPLTMIWGWGCRWHHPSTVCHLSLTAGPNTPLSSRTWAENHLIYIFWVVKPFGEPGRVLLWIAIIHFLNKGSSPHCILTITLWGSYLWIIFVKRKLSLLNVIYQVLQLVKERTGTNLAILLTFIHLNHLFSLSFCLTGRLIRYPLLC